MIKKINCIIYNKLLLQAEEAESQGLVKLAESIRNAIGEKPENDICFYSYRDLEDDITNKLWELACCVLKYYDLKSVDAQQINSLVESYSSKFLSELEQLLNTDKIKVGPLEPEVPGELK
jgi:hypothetical protein